MSVVYYLCCPKCSTRLDDTWTNHPDSIPSKIVQYFIKKHVITCQAWTLHVWPDTNAENIEEVFHKVEKSTDLIEWFSYYQKFKGDENEA